MRKETGLIDDPAQDLPLVPEYLRSSFDDLFPVGENVDSGGCFNIEEEVRCEFFDTSDLFFEAAVT